MSDSAFKVLGLKRSASIDDIKRAYRVLAKTCHPDVNPTGQARFIEITEAYESALRAPPASDDTFQEAPMPPRGGSVPPAPPPTPRPPAPRHDPFADFQRSHARGAPGPWREVVEMSLEEVFVGTMVSVRHGTGSVLVTVPVGAPNGIVIVQRGVIPASIGQMRRDLHVTVRYARHAVFTPQGVDLLMTLKVGVDLAHKGGEQTIPGPEGKPVWVKIAPRSRSGTVLRMPQRGLPIPGGRRGDLLITLLVTLT